MQWVVSVLSGNSENVRKAPALFPGKMYTRMRTPSVADIWWGDRWWCCVCPGFTLPSRTVVLTLLSEIRFLGEFSKYTGCVSTALCERAEDTLINEEPRLEVQLRSKTHSSYGGAVTGKAAKPSGGEWGLWN